MNPFTVVAFGGTFGVEHEDGLTLAGYATREEAHMEAVRMNEDIRRSRRADALLDVCLRANVPDHEIHEALNRASNDFAHEAIPALEQLAAQYGLLAEVGQ